MMKSTVRLFCLSALAVGIACAASPYRVKIYRPTVVGTTELSAGDYKVEMQGDKAVFTSGKKSVQVPATLEKGDKKFPVTTYTALDSKIKQIELGGTTDKIIFATESASSSGTK